MRLFGGFGLQSGESTPTKMAVAVGVAITNYVDGCFPEIQTSFEEIICLYGECDHCHMGDDMAEVLFKDDENEVILRGFPQFFYFPALCFAYAHDAMVAESNGDLSRAWALLANATYWLGIIKGGGVYDNIARDIKSSDARIKANLLHDQPGGSREKKMQMRELWASGKYSNRSLCAEQECAALDMSYDAARKALRNTPDPS